ncbi:unnamed protein product [Paramecium primaurelia]|uniref:Protein kinase domain-containing protein n=1 Tax=Paramecium primaurelia TaxID=5886 RepID=A0A8S1KBN4_PARPR|nr:unnamed protein product [Paramecium primaurelia]
MEKEKVYPGKKIGDYIFMEELGRGNYGCVYKCKNISDQSIHAIKVIEYQSPSFKGGIVGQLLKEEINSLAQIESPYVLRLEHYLQTTNRCYIVMEYCDSGDLYQYWLRYNRILDENKTLVIIRQILNGLMELHKNKIIHRDLKLANILLNKSQVKLADLGFCKRLKDNDVHDKLQLGSPGTIAPEIVNKESYGLQSDIFSIGCIFYQLLFGELPFNFHSTELYLKQIDEQQINFRRNGVKVSKNVQSIIQRMLVRDPKKRLTFSELYQFDLFKKKINENLQFNQIQNEVQNQINQDEEDWRSIINGKDQPNQSNFYDDIYKKNQDEILKNQDFTYVEANNGENLQVFFTNENGKDDRQISNNTIKLNQQIKARKYVTPLKEDKMVFDQIQKDGLQFKPIQPRVSSSIILFNEFKQSLNKLQFCEQLYNDLKEFIQSDQINLLIGRLMLLKSMIIEVDQLILKNEQNCKNQDNMDLKLQDLLNFPFSQEFNLLISKIKEKIQQNKKSLLSPEVLSNHTTDNFSSLLFQGLLDIHSYLRDETNKEPEIIRKKQIAITILKVQTCVNFHELDFSNIDLKKQFEKIKQQNIIEILQKIYVD